MNRDLVSAIILLTVKRGRVQLVGGALAAVEGISEMFSVGGRYDLVRVVTG